MSIPLTPRAADVLRPGRTLADALLTVPDASRRIADMLLVLGASLFIALSARVEFVLPFTPIPITGQTFAVLMTGVLLGSRRGFLAVLVYLAEGAAGLPVFSGGGYGLLKFAGPTAGYLLAFPLGAALTGWLAERGWDRKPYGAATAIFLGSLVILTLGSLWLGMLQGNLGRGFALGMLPFLPGDVVKTVLASALLPGAWVVVRRIRGGGD